MLQPPYLAVVDDDEFVLKALKRLLKPTGLEVRAFNSAKALLRAVEEREPQVVVSDLQMPGMSGLEMLDVLLGQGRRIPIIFITAFDDDEVRQQAFARGAAGFLSKPFNKQVILDLVATARGVGAGSGSSTSKLRLSGKPGPSPGAGEMNVVDFELSDLLPCPFCQTYARLDKATWVDEQDRNRFMARIVCPRCQASVPSTASLIFLTFSGAAKDAMQNWNRRTAPAKP